MESYGFTSRDTVDNSMASNLLKIQVYFSTLNVEKVTESPTYEVIAFMKICNRQNISKSM